MTNRFRFMFLLLVPVLALGMNNVAKAGEVNVWSIGLGSSLAAPVNDFYNSLSGHNSTIITGSLDSNDLTGVDLLWVIQPPVLSVLEINTLSLFLAGGGRIAFMGEHGTSLRAEENDNISAAVTALGGHMTILNNSLNDALFHTASKANGQILNHPLTEGVNTYEYAAFAPLIITSPPAEKLMLGINLTSVMMAFENIGPGSIFMITDQNVLNFSGNVDNDVMFENLLSGDTGAPPPVAVPVPAMSEWAMIMLTLLLGLMVFANRRSLF